MIGLTRRRGTCFRSISECADGRPGSGKNRAACPSRHSAGHDRAGGGAPLFSPIAVLKTVTAWQGPVREGRRTDAKIGLGEVHALARSSRSQA